MRCDNCGNEVDENEMYCRYCSYNIQEGLGYMQQLKAQHEGKGKTNWFNKILGK